MAIKENGEGNGRIRLSRRTFSKGLVGLLGSLALSGIPGANSITIDSFQDASRQAFQRRSYQFGPENLRTPEASAFPKDLFVDTWWYGLTSQWTEEEFMKAAKLRKEQGFNAIQFVVGVPPEVGPSHPSAESDAGFPYDLNGKINEDYLELARDRIKKLNDLGLKTIIYGAWGYQIDWFGVEWMKDWWGKVVEYTKDTDSIYSLTGESNLMIGMEKKLWPNKSNDDLLGFLPDGIRTPVMLFGAQSKEFKWFMEKVNSGDKQERIDAWSDVLKYLYGITNKPLIIHPSVGEISENVVNDPQFLSAVTSQTGHEGLNDGILELPLKLKEHFNKPFVDLEHIYEGITDKFYGNSQLLAYWLSVIAGADGFFYGAQGIWQLGNGNFIRHWGRQTWQQAFELETPNLLSKSNEVWKNYKASILEGEIFYITGKEGLVAIGRKSSDGKKSIIFYPDSRFMPKGFSKYYLPETGEFVREHPEKGQAVAINF